MLPNNDLQHILTETWHLWDEIRGCNIFVTGGTGFFGTWIRESFEMANIELDLRAKMFILSRNPHEDTDSVKYIRGDVRNIVLGPQCDFVIHGAAETGKEVTMGDPLKVLDTIVEGTRNTLDFAVRQSAKKFLFISSGAVYSNHDLGWEASYATGKRTAELIGAYYSRKYAFEFKIARCFAFLGPGMDINGHYAIGNFIRNAVDNIPIRVKDGSPVRSYMYASDLAIWLWTILFRGKSCVAYDVGSDKGMTIAEVAEKVARQAYVPVVSFANNLGLRQTIDFDESTKRTMAWYWKGNHIQ